MPAFGYAFIVCGVLAFANWMQWTNGQRLYAKAAAVAQERDQARADLAGIQEQTQALNAALSARDAATARLRRTYETQARAVTRIPSGGCLDELLPDPAADALRMRDDTADTAPVPPAPPDAGAAPGP